MADQNRQTEAGQGADFVTKPVSRRDFLKAAGIAGATMGLGAGLGGALAACGTSETTTTAPTTATTTASTAATTATTAAASTTTVSAGPESGRDIKVGLVSPQTGALAAFAVADDWQVKHVETALKDGVVCGDGKLHKIQILVRDSMSDSNRAAQVGGDLLNNDKADIILVSGTADTVSPVADQCEAAGTVCLSNSIPWQSYYFGRGATPDKPFKWTYAHAFGLEQGIADYIDAWGQVPTNKIVGLLWSNNADGQAWANDTTGMPPAIKKAGFTAVQPQLYQPGSEDYTQQISAFKKAGCDIQFGVANAPDFANFWKQCLQQGYNPKLMGCAKALVQPEELNALGDIGIGLYTSAGWHPSWPFKDSLTGMTCQEISDEYEQITGREWATVIQEYPRFEWAVDVLKRAKDMDSAEALLAAVVTTKMETIIGPLDLTSPVKMGTDHPVPNVYRPQYAGGQWRKGTKWPYELYVMSNAGAPLVTVQSKIQPMVYSS